MNCPKCDEQMHETRGYKKSVFNCSGCGYTETRINGKKKVFSIRLYPFQKHKADKRGGVQMVVDSILTDEDE